MSDSLSGNHQKQPRRLAGTEPRGVSSDHSPLQVVAGLARGADCILTALLSFLLALILLYACFALWDTWRIYDNAGIDESLLQYKPELNSDNSDSFAELMAINPDVCAWLTVEDTNIDYPVLQGTDNTTYINTDVYGNFSLSGSIFLDCRNAADFTDSYSLIYGHHMDGAVMFGELAYFIEQAYFQEHDSGILYLPDCTYRISFFASLQTDAYDDQMFSPGDLTEEEMDALLTRIRTSAIQYRETDVTAEDRILALSTCSDASTNARTMVFGRLEEISSREGGTLEE